MGAIREMLLDYKEEIEKWLEGSVKTRNYIEEELKNFNERVSEAKEKIKEIDELLGEKTSKRSNTERSQDYTVKFTQIKENE